jgi:DNA-binding transcriptional MerR regulator
MTAGTPRWRIEELAREAGVTVRTIRFYQQQGVLAPPQREGRVAWYRQEHVLRLRKIAELQARGYTLEMIKVMLGGTGRGWPPEVWQDFKQRIVRRRPAYHHVSAGELARGAAISPALAQDILASARAAGLIAPDAPETALPPAALAAITSAARAGLDARAVTELLGRYHRVSREIADGLAQLFVAGVLRPALEQGPDGADWSRLLQTFEELCSGAELALAEAGRFALQAAMESTRRKPLAPTGRPEAEPASAGPPVARSASVGPPAAEPAAAGPPAAEPAAAGPPAAG